ncbi:MAG: hypothetical protein PHW60_06860 [Kiritimatiellae bacterium]|nr:hypothetical protein [Kiritimatiellia bacterium]
MKTANRDSGVVLVAVVCLAAVAAVLAIGLLSESGAMLKVAGRQAAMEQAFYIAEGGAERAVAYIQQAGTNLVAGNTITGLIGSGRFSTSIFGSTTIPSTSGAHTVEGWININPNNSAGNEFLLLMTDGESFTRDDLDQDLADYGGTASLVHVKPKGNQTDLNVDNVVYPLDKNYAYTFSAASMNVVLTNNSRNAQGKAVGQWLIYINGNDVDIDDDSGGSSEIVQYFTIYSVGTVEASRRLVILEGVHQMSWAKYALWYESGPGEIWIRGGERFDGPVHANTYIYLKEDPVFNALISSTRSSWGNGAYENSNTNAVHFNAGYLLGAPAQSMASINFSNLVAHASMVITGTTDITLSGTNILVSNSRGGWSNSLMVFPSNGLIYIKTATNAPDLSKTGTVSVAGTLDGRLSIACDYDIKIANHITYANTNIALGLTNTSDDALGLIAKHDAIVMKSAPNNLNIYAHIIAEGSATAGLKDGSFYVQNYDSRANSGYLNVYGGIVQYYRGAVGTFGGWWGNTGFSKNYIFDQRFTARPPPQYPAVTNDYQWQGWRDKPL